MEDIGLARHAPKTNNVGHEAEHGADATHLRNPRWPVSGIDCDNGDSRALAPQEFAQLPRLIGHPAFGRRHRPNERNAESREIHIAAGASRPKISRYRATLPAQLRSRFDEVPAVLAQ